MIPRADPVVICGLDRTGKTALRIALDASPSITMVRHLDLWTEIFGRFGDLAEDRNARRLADALIANRQLARQLVDSGRLVEAVMARPRSYRAVFSAIGRQLAERAGKPRWGEQTALAERHADAILATFPGARIIHMLRDPRDRFAAIVRSGSRRGGVAPVTAAWQESDALAERNERRHAGRYAVVRLESFLAAPEETLRRLCKFTGLTYLSSMTEAARGAGRGPQDEPIASGIFNAVLSGRQIAFIQARAGDRMASREYVRVPVRLSPLDRARYWVVDAPLNWGAGLAWAVRERAQRAAWDARAESLPSETASGPTAA